MITSELRANSMGVGATFTLCSAAKSAARADVRLKTVRGKPAAATFEAIGLPITPSPAKPIRGCSVELNITSIVQQRSTLPGRRAMMAAVESGSDIARRDLGGSDNVGQQLRAAREAKSLSLRELARRLDISASALSQIETGKSLPSVKTLYAIVSELGLSLDGLFAPGAESEGWRPRSSTEAPGSPVQRADSRASLRLDSGVKWDRLTSGHDQDVDFYLSTYDVHGSSSSSGDLVRHSGREYGLVLSGRLEVTVGFEKYSLEPGDSISFDSSDPHMLRNVGDVPVEAVWIVIGRRESDPRQPTFSQGVGPH
jgi:transcriptional regulator with XRE-family HTH domain